MKLTERQCWDAIREMVKIKNEEYSSLLYTLFDSAQMREVLGYTRDNFLAKMGFSSLSEFNSQVKKKNKTLSSQWLDNLSSEDLLLFLDFRCRYLQDIYNYYKSHSGRISKDIIRSIVQNTKISQLKSYNYGKLNCSGKPARKNGEKKIQEIYLQSNQIQSNAINQVLTRMANKYQEITESSDERVEQLVSKITTSNINLKGNLTGYRFKGNLDIFEQFEQVNRPKFVGLDIQGTPVYEDEDGCYTSTGVRLNEEDYIYDTDEIDKLGL